MRACIDIFTSTWLWLPCRVWPPFLCLIRLGRLDCPLYTVVHMSCHILSSECVLSTVGETLRCHPFLAGPSHYEPGIICSVSRSDGRFAHGAARCPGSRLCGMACALAAGLRCCPSAGRIPAPMLTPMIPPVPCPLKHVDSYENLVELVHDVHLASACLPSHISRPPVPLPLIASANVVT